MKKPEKIYFSDIEYAVESGEFIITDEAGVKHHYPVQDYDVVAYPNYVVVAEKDCDFITESIYKER